MYINKLNYFRRFIYFIIPLYLRNFSDIFPRSGILLCQRILIPFSKIAVNKFKNFWNYSAIFPYFHDLKRVPFLKIKSSIFRNISGNLLDPPIFKNWDCFAIFPGSIIRVWNYTPTFKVVIWNLGQYYGVNRTSKVEFTELPKWRFGTLNYKTR